MISSAPPERLGISAVGFVKAAAPDDVRFDVFQDISDAARITIGAGMPTKHDDGIRISLLLFRPDQPRSIYSKSYLHTDEVPYFVPGRNAPRVTINGTRVALAICFEISVPEHLESALASAPAGPTRASKRALPCLVTTRVRRSLGSSPAE